MKYQSVKGTRDVLPEEQPYWRHIEAQIYRICTLYGYERIDTPIFEQTQLFERGVGTSTDIVEKEMYTFWDRGHDSLTLRPEFTAGVIRASLQNGLHTRPKPVRLFSIGPIFRYERPQAGRFRQHTQFNVEALGEQDPAMDVEVMSIAWQLYADLGFRGLCFQLNSTGCPQCRPGYLKVLREYYQTHFAEICPDCQRRLERSPLRVLDCKVDSCQPIIAKAPPLLEHLCADCASHFAKLRQYLELLGRPYTLNHRLVRGLDYYTKTVFEVWVQGIGAQNAMCGGGRYDGLIEQLGGPPTPGIGFGSGIERIILSMKEQGLSVPALPKPQVFVASQGESARLVALRVLFSLRESGVATTFAPGDRSLKAQLREANRVGARVVLIVGEEEVANQTVSVKDMASGAQEMVRLEQVVENVSKRLNALTDK
ncbi:MAG: histidine--tRNA ligase [bacterium]|nr:histidine--tRNA ligase [candidate division KSB1 bacterium]MDH7559747.1 histidine--tRNA ligase [bacterium]